MGCWVGPRVLDEFLIITLSEVLMAFFLLDFVRPITPEINDVVGAAVVVGTLNGVIVGV